MKYSASASSASALGNWSVSQPILLVAAIDVDRSRQMPSAAGERHFVLERVAGQRGVVRLDVQLDLASRARMCCRKPYDGRSVEIVLMLGRLAAASARSGSCP